MHVRGTPEWVSGLRLLERIRAVILLGGSVRRTSFAAATGRTILDLPVRSGWSLLEHWRDQVAEVAAELGRDELPIRLLLDGMAQPPLVPAPRREAPIRLERDPRPFRGTGGILRDACEMYDADDYVLVGNAAQVLLEPLVETVAAMAATAGEICVVSHPDGTPSGLMLFRCRCLSRIPDVGFYDMKEQALPLIAEHHKGSVVYRRIPCGLPVKNLEGYIKALSWHHRCSKEEGAIRSPFEEDWQPTFSIIEDGAEVDPGARLHDSIVLRGGRVAREAFVVRSIVCPNAVVATSATVVNSLVSEAG